MLQHIRLLILDLDYLVFDCSLLKIQALRQSMISLADCIPQDVRLPDTIDVEEGFRNHGFRWLSNLQIGLDEEKLDHLQRAYSIYENRLVEGGAGGLFPGIQEFLVNCRQLDLGVALGAEASREYLLGIADRHQLDHLFQISVCSEEFGAGGVDEMFDEIVRLAEVNPSETLVLGTRPYYFEAARNLDMASIGCGWGIRRHNSLDEANHRALTLAQLYTAIQEADKVNSQLL